MQEEILSSSWSSMSIRSILFSLINILLVAIHFLVYLFFFVSGKRLWHLHTEMLHENPNVLFAYLALITGCDYVSYWQREWPCAIKSAVEICASHVELSSWFHGGMWATFDFEEGLEQQNYACNAFSSCCMAFLTHLCNCLI